jgi:hypothetical protein
MKVIYACYLSTYLSKYSKEDFMGGGEREKERQRQRERERKREREREREKEKEGRGGGGRGLIIAFELLDTDVPETI